MTFFRDTEPPVGDAMRDFLEEGETALLIRVRAVRRSRRGRRAFVTGGLAAVLVAGGGVAYARGAVPDFLERATAESAAEAGSSQRTRNVTNIVDLDLPDGSRFGAWRWEVGGQLCVASADNWNGATTGSGGVGCGPDSGDNQVNVAWAFGRGFEEGVVQPMYPVLFGYTTDDSIVAVRLAGTVLDTGGTVERVIPVDKDNGGFGTVLPGTVGNTFDPKRRSRAHLGVALTYLDADGHSVGPRIDLMNGR